MSKDVRIIEEIKGLGQYLIEKGVDLQKKAKYIDSCKPGDSYGDAVDESLNIITDLQEALEEISDALPDLALE